MALTDSAIRRAKPQLKPYKLSDEKGLYLLVHPSGGRYWRMKYRLHGREKLLALGVYDEVSLAKARERRDDARKLIADDKDPGQAKLDAKKSAADTFKVLAEEWLQLRQGDGKKKDEGAADGPKADNTPSSTNARAGGKPKKKGARQFEPATMKKARWMFDDLIFPYIGKDPMRAISPEAILRLLKKLEVRDKIETAHRVKQRISQVFRYAIAHGKADRDPTWGLSDALPPVSVTHRAAITEPAKVGALLRAVDGYDGQPSVHYALRLAPLLFVRPGELRNAEWPEFNLDGKDPEWRIPAARMKMRTPHIVPLSHQAVTLLEELRPVNSGRLLFPGLRTAARPISNATMGAALRRLGYSGDEMTAHGFRSIASTLLNEQGYAPDVIELQLAHKERNHVRGAYNRAERLEERRKMMQAWADYLDGLRAGGNVVAIKRTA